MVQKHRKNSATRTVKKRERLRTKALYRDANQVADEAVSRSGSTNPVSRYFQKKRIKRQYVAQARTARQAHLTQKRGRRAKKATGKARNPIKQFRRKKSKVYLAIALVAFLFLGSIFSFFFSAGTILGGSAIGGIAGTPPGGKIFISPFDFDWTPTVTDRFGYRTHPVTGEENSFHTGLTWLCRQGHRYGPYNPERFYSRSTVQTAMAATSSSSTKTAIKRFMPIAVSFWSLPDKRSRWAKPSPRLVRPERQPETICISKCVKMASF